MCNWLCYLCKRAINDRLSMQIIIIVDIYLDAMIVFRWEYSINDWQLTDWLICCLNTPDTIHVHSLLHINALFQLIPCDIIYGIIIVWQKGAIPWTRGISLLMLLFIVHWEKTPSLLQFEWNWWWFPQLGESATVS